MTITASQTVPLRIELNMLLLDLQPMSPWINAFATSDLDLLPRKVTIKTLRQIRYPNSPVEFPLLVTSVAGTGLELTDFVQLLQRS